MFYLWLFVIILLTVVEVATINLTTIWFIASAIISLILSFFIDEFVVQFAVFTILGIFLLITTRPIIKKYLVKNNESTNIDRVIGMNGIVTEEIKKNSTGEVKVDGKRWTAYSNEDINVNSIVKVLEINGVKIKVEKVEE